MRSGKPRPNVYKRDAQASTWAQEVGAWLVVVMVIVLLRGLYYLVEGV